MQRSSRHSTLKPLSGIIKYITGPLGKRFGAERVKIIFEWELIIGSEIAKFTTPCKIVATREKKILIIISNNSSAAAMLSFTQNLITEKVNSYFGYQVIDGIKIRK